jgi:hypothetical protein
MPNFTASLKDRYLEAVEIQSLRPFLPRSDLGRIQRPPLLFSRPRQRAMRCSIEMGADADFTFEQPPQAGRRLPAERRVRLFVSEACCAHYLSQEACSNAARRWRTGRILEIRFADPSLPLHSTTRSPSEL